MKTTFTLALFLFSGLGIAVAKAAPLDKPNLLLIYCDDLGWGDVSFNGHPIVKTPNIDALAAEGMIFDHNYAGAPHCSLSRAVLMLSKSSYRVDRSTAMLIRGERPATIEVRKATSTKAGFASQDSRSGRARSNPGKEAKLPSMRGTHCPRLPKRLGLS